jgi:hypothetical protein
MFGQAPSVPAEKPSEASQLGAATLGTNPNVRASFLEPATFDAVPPPTPAQRTGTPAQLPDPFFSRTPVTAAPPANPSFTNSPGMDNPGVNRPGMNRSGSTTDVFRMPAGDAPSVERAPSGPSEFTVFLSRSQLNASLASESSGHAPTGGGQTPVFPPAPAPPPFQFAPPPPPAVKFPAAPAAPAVPVAAPKPAGFWPLIVVLTVLLAIAGLMVMYFVLKH